MRLSNIKEYVLEEKFKVIYYDKKLDIINYIKVEHFDSNKISISYKEGIINILGTKLVITRLLKDELVISGYINKMEFNNYE